MHKHIDFNVVPSVIMELFELTPKHIHDNAELRKTGKIQSTYITEIMR